MSGRMRRRWTRWAGVAAPRPGTVGDLEVRAMTSGYESWIDRRIRQAEERGEFDGLAGAGKPLSDLDPEYDENWWLKALVRREQITGAVPASLRLRKEVDDLPESVAA